MIADMEITGSDQQINHLLPCPFCGADGKLIDRQGWGAPRWKAHCSKGCCDMWPKDAAADAISAWNLARASKQDERPVTTCDDVVEAANALLEAYRIAADERMSLRAIRPNVEVLQQALSEAERCEISLKKCVDIAWETIEYEYDSRKPENMDEVVKAVLDAAGVPYVD